MAETKIDPLNIEALEKSLNDSATRVSTIWVSFLIFLLYLLTAAITVTHRQLLLAEPVKLPVLNIELPLWGFFFLAPVLLIIFQAYLLIQLVLLGRTAAVYNDAVDRAVRSPPGNAAMRQRLANTLFAQIFAGSPREREGWLGSLLRVMAWITLLLAPTLILLVFQFMFLPYHSHFVTWTHRLLVALELTTMVLLPSLISNSQLDFERRRLNREFRRLAAFPKSMGLFLFWPLLPKRHWGLDWSKSQQQREYRRLRHQFAPISAIILFVVISLSIATFPGEPLVNLFSGRSPSSVQCTRWLSTKFDRLNLSGIDVIDIGKLAKTGGDISEETELARSPRTLHLQERNFDCANFDGADFRQADFSRSTIVGASFIATKLDAVSFRHAQLNESSFEFASLRRASFADAMLKGATFQSASAVGADLHRAQLQGAKMSDASFLAANLSSAQLQGAHIQDADLRAAFLVSTALTAADLSGARLEGAFLPQVQLQGANLEGANTNLAIFENAFVWRSAGQRCDGAHVAEPVFDPIIGFSLDGSPFFGAADQMVQVTDATVEQLVEAATKNISPEWTVEITLQLQKLSGSKLKTDNDTISMTAWKACATQSMDSTESAFFRKHSDFLINIACDSVFDWQPAMEGIIDNWIFDMYGPPDRVDYLGRALLGLDGRECRSTKHLNDFLKERVRARLKADKRITPETHN